MSKGKPFVSAVTKPRTIRVILENCIANQQRLLIVEDDRPVGDMAVGIAVQGSICTGRADTRCGLRQALAERGVFHGDVAGCWMG